MQGEGNGKRPGLAKVCVKGRIGEDGSDLHGGLECAVDLGGDDGDRSEAAGAQEVHAVHTGRHHRPARHGLGRQPRAYVDPAQHLWTPACISSSS